MMAAARFGRPWLVALSLGGLRLLVPSLANAQAQDDGPRIVPAERPPLSPPAPAPAPPTEPPPAPAEPPPSEPPPPATVAPAAPATPHRVGPSEPPFGAPGEVVVTNALSVGLYTTAYDRSPATFRGAAFSPGVDVFVVRDVSLGIDLDLAVGHSTAYADGLTLVSTKATTVAVGPRVGFNLHLGESWSFYPRLTFGYRTTHVAQHEPVVDPRTSRPDTEVNTYGAWIGVFAPLLYHPAPHFFIGAGPSLHHDLGGGQSQPEGARTSIAARTVVGVWWGGPDPSGPHTDASPAPRQRRFGERGQLVLTGEAGASIGADSYEHQGPGFGVSAAPGFDYFVTEHASVGFAARAAYSNVRYVRHDGRDGTSERAGVALAPRFGVDLPLSELLSFYPRAYFSFGFDSTSFDQLTRKTVFVALGAYAPLLIHVASHAFLGVGPSVSHELLRQSADGDAEQPLGTTAGASVIVGGWL